VWNKGATAGPAPRKGYIHRFFYRRTEHASFIA